MPFINSREILFSPSPSESEDTDDNYIAGYRIRFLSDGTNIDDLSPQDRYAIPYHEILRNENPEMEIIDDGEYYVVDLNSLDVQGISGRVTIFVTTVDQAGNESEPNSIDAVLDFVAPKPVGAIFLR